MVDKLLLFKCLSDASRLRIINQLLKGPMYVELLSEVIGITPATISFHLKKLEEVGLVTSKKEQYYTVFSINKKALDSKLIDLVGEDEMDVELKREKEYRKKIINTFFEYGKLKSIPVQQKKRRIILEEVVKQFEKNKIYTEKEVNLIIADLHDDFCTIRKYLVDESLMIRTDGLYRLI